MLEWLSIVSHSQTIYPILVRDVGISFRVFPFELVVKMRLWHRNLRRLTGDVFSTARSSQLTSYLMSDSP